MQYRVPVLFLPCFSMQRASIFLHEHHVNYRTQTTTKYLQNEFEYGWLSWVARLLVTAALWFRIQTSVARQKKNFKDFL
jgi:hypothetical protein